MALPSDPFLTTLAPMYFGTCALFVCFGMACVQYFVYCSRHRYPDEDPRLRLYAAFVFALGLVPTINSFLSAFDHLVTHWGDVARVAPLDVPQRATMFVEGPVPFVVQLFFAWRTYAIVENRWVCLLICLTSCTGYIASVVSSVLGLSAGSIGAIARLRVTVTMWYSSFLVADLIITVTLFYYLRQSRTGFSSMENFLSKTTTLALQTGLIPTLFTVMTLVFYLSIPSSPSLGSSYIAWILPTSSVYVNCFLAVLNSRPSQQDQDAEDGFSKLTQIDSVSTLRTKMKRRRPRATSTFTAGPRSAQMLHRPVHEISVISDRVQLSASPITLDCLSIAEDNSYDERTTPDFALGPTRHSSCHSTPPRT